MVDKKELENILKSIEFIQSYEYDVVKYGNKKLTSEYNTLIDLEDEMNKIINKLKINKPSKIMLERLFYYLGK